MTPDTQASACVIARRQRRSNLKLAVAPKLDCFTPFAMTPQKPNQMASLAFAMTPQGPRHRSRNVSLRGGTTKQSQPAVASNPDCFTPFAMTPQKPNQIASLMFATTPQGQRHRPRTVSLRGGNDEAISNQRRPQTRLLHSVRNGTQEQHHRTRIVSLRGGNDEAI